MRWAYGFAFQKGCGAAEVLDMELAALLYNLQIASWAVNMPESSISKSKGILLRQQPHGLLCGCAMKVLELTQACLLRLPRTHQCLWTCSCHVMLYILMLSSACSKTVASSACRYCCLIDNGVLLKLVSLQAANCQVITPCREICYAASTSRYDMLRSARSRPQCLSQVVSPARDQQPQQMHMLRSFQLTNPPKSHVQVCSCGCRWLRRT